MGFFSWAWNCVRKVVTAPRQAVATALKGLGSFMSRSTADPIWNLGMKLEEIGETLTPRCYRESEKSVSSQIDVSKDCQGFYNMAREALSPKLERFCRNERDRIYACKEKMQWLVPDEVFSRIEAAIPDEPFEEICKSCWDTIAVSISIENKEFLRCLELEGSRERTDKCKEYVVETVNTLARGAGEQITQKSDKIVLEMLQELDAYLCEQETQLREHQQELDEMQKQRDNPDFVQRRLCGTIVDIAYLSCILSAAD